VAHLFTSVHERSLSKCIRSALAHRWCFVMMSKCFALVAAFSFMVSTDCVELREAALSRQMALEAEWGSELQAPKVVEYQSPIKRVVALLGKMKAELEHEAKNEAEMYDKMVCWCETNSKEKNQAIKDADDKDKQLSAEIESRSARFGALETTISTLKKEIKDLTEALAKATEIREKEAGAFAGEEKSLTQALTNLKNAIIILSKHNSFLQAGSTVVLGVKTVLRDLAVKHELLADRDPSMRRSMGLQGAFIALQSSSERASVQESQGMNRELLKALDVKAAGGDDNFPLKYAERLLAQTVKTVKPATVFLQLEKPPSYSSGSGPVFGMLKQMQADFKSALAKSQEDEKKDIAAFEDLEKAKSAQIEASKEKLDDLEDEAADNTKALSDAKEDLEMNREQRSADVKFLTNLKKTCTNLNAQWEARSKTRSQELQAVSEAAAIISDDDNMDLMRNSVQLLQVKAKAADTRRAKAADVLSNGFNSMFDGADDLLSAWEGRHSNSAIRSASDSLRSSRTQLAALAVTVRLDTFTKVKEAMDKLAAELKKQQSEEVDFKAKCVKDFNGNEKAVFKKTDEKEDLQAQIQELASLMKGLDKEIADNKKQVSDTQVQMKKASQNREAENKEFQSVVADQRATQDILKKALAKLTAFYKKSFVQIEEVQTPPAQFTDYKKNSGSSPVMGMIEQIIEDSVRLEQESMAGEKQAQAEYVKFVKDSNALIKSLSEAVVEKTKAIADAKSKTADSKGDLQSAEGELESLSKVEEDLHNECDFVLKNFEIRQKARATELEAIQAAKAILSGAKSS